MRTFLIRMNPVSLALSPSFGPKSPRVKPYYYFFLGRGGTRWNILQEIKKKTDSRTLFTSCVSWFHGSNNTKNRKLFLSISFECVLCFTWHWTMILVTDLRDKFMNTILFALLKYDIFIYYFFFLKYIWWKKRSTCRETHTHTQTDIERERERTKRSNVRREQQT